MSKVVTSLFNNRAAASAAVDRLVAAGFGTADVSVLMAQDTDTHDLGARRHETVAAPPVVPPASEHPADTVVGHDPEARPRSISLGEAPAHPPHLVETHAHADAPGVVDPLHPGGRNFAMAESSKAPEGATAGATVGGALGGILMGLAATGLVLIPGLNVVAAGPILAVLAGIGGGGAVGGLLGGLVGLGIPEHEAKLVEQGLEQGNVLVGVRAHADRVEAAKQILREAGGTYVH